MTTNLKNLTFLTAGAFAGFFGFQSLAFASDYSRPISGMQAENRLNFRIGEGVFQKFWVPAPSSTTASDGLGPLFNTRSCNSCHVSNGRGHAPEAGVNGVTVPSTLIRFGKLYKNTSQVADFIYPSVGDKHYGNQLQGQASPGILPEGDYQLAYTTHVETLADGTQVELRKPQVKWTNLNYGNLEDTTGVTLLVSPALVGMGLLDNIPDDTIIANADPEDKNNDGISGKVSWIPGHGDRLIGRFGYKAATPSVSVQNQMAFNTDLGLSTPLTPKASGDCTALQQACIDSPDGNSPHLDNLEVDHQQSDLVDLFVSLSSPPSMRNLREPRFLEGKAIFDESGCASCHVPKMQTRKNATFNELSDRVFYPFTDMLLHDMGPALASGFQSFSATPNEWRTAPLWGIGLSEKVSGRVGFLHDGRARNIEEAILWHGGEAQQSKEFYKQLNKENRKTFIYFLESL